VTKPATPTRKYQQVYSALRRDIQSGRLAKGDRLPSEADLGRLFGASRITVGRAVRDLQAAGLVERRAGAGTFVKVPAAAGGLSFGLLIPNLGETEIFEPICQGMMASPLAEEHALLWGSLNGASRSREEDAWRLCRQYIDRRVSGVFFAPLEMTAAKDSVNEQIAAALDAAHIPVVLLDRTVEPYPQRGHHDLVGIDNRRAGYVITEHLLQRGARRLAFVGPPHAAATVDARAAGYREALYAAGAAVDPALVQRIDPEDSAAVNALMTHHPEGIVCANDRTAARIMRTLLGLGCKVPDDIRLVGIDDADFAELLPVPLTTLRQPSRQIGDAALTTMLQRVARRDLPTRDVLLHCELIERASS
jgi:GntR family transcriptional regulator, arabinose operon transcriptional repressor